MHIEVARIPPEGKQFAGEEPAGCLDLGAEPGVSAEGPIAFDCLRHMAESLGASWPDSALNRKVQ